MILGKYSIGIGDRFGQEGKAQLAAIIKAKEHGVNITPVWNKSQREHTIIGTKPADTRKEADEAVKACRWDGPYFVDADHVGLNSVGQFVKHSDFFTLDVAHLIAKTAGESEINAFIKKYRKYAGSLSIPGIDAPFDVTEERLRAIVGKFLLAIKEAGRIYRLIAAAKGIDKFITEISMDETVEPQSPLELLFILALISDEGIPIRTIAPKFVGRFYKGVDYVGSVAKFTRQFEENLAVISFAIKEFGLLESLKLSLHSASDKFSIYGVIKTTLKKFDAGLHFKTAGTTWLEEIISLAMAGGEGLTIAKRIYARALLRIDELCEPYATVIDIDRTRLPGFKVVDKWDEAKFAATLRHDKSCKDYNPHFRQLMHVAYKIAAEMGRRYLDLLTQYRDLIAQNVTENIYERHIKPVLLV
jgi:hypothetical protein